jgi:hypothetical protein
MALPSLATLAACALVFVVYKVISQIIRYRFFHPLSEYPGPFWGSVTRLWIAYHNYKADELQVVKALHEKYGMRSNPTVSLVVTAVFCNAQTCAGKGAQHR